MSDQNGDKILQLNNVRYCKNSGTLHLLTKCLEWMKADDDTSHINIPFTDIKNQKISPEGKSKVQLQVVLYNQTSHTFHFANPDGVKIQKEERDKVKELVTQHVLKTRKKQPDELMEKKRILEENPHLKELYMTLVPTEILAADDFWKEIAGKYKQTLTPELDVGVSGAFLADIKPQTDGANGRVMYNLTPEIMTAVFKTYPAVKKKHEEYVPHQMTESEFWTRFFQSHYYSTHSTSRSENVFSECVKYDDREWSKDLSTIRNDPLYDLTDIYEDKPMEVDSELKVTRNKPGSNQIHATMIKRFNQHSLNILKSQVASEKEKMSETETDKKTVKSEPLTNGHAANGTDAMTISANKKRKLEEKLEYEDLENVRDESKSSLIIHQKNRYLSGPSAHNLFYGGISVEDLPALHHQLSCTVRSWHPDLHQSQSSSRALSVLQRISQSSKLSRADQTSGHGNTLPRDLHNELVKIYRSSGELLRHFWACFPPRTSQLQEKLHRMHNTISRYNDNIIREFQNQAGKELGHQSPVLEHIQQMIFIANNKYESWKARNGR